MDSKIKLYIFTGKGGVGKTTLAYSFTRYLRSLGLNAKYVTFKNQSLSENHNDQTEMKTIHDVPNLLLDLEDTAKSYIEKKLKSSMVSGWIVKTPFFRALINMVPGFNYLIFLGRILEEIKHGENSPVIVLDAPASGHALTMMEATQNFAQIFESGTIFDDTKKMLAMLSDPAFTKINIVTLPTLMSWHEAMDLQAELNKRTPVTKSVVVNNCLCLAPMNEAESLPQALSQKIANERQLLEKEKDHFILALPHSLEANEDKIQQDILGNLEKLV